MNCDKTLRDIWAATDKRTIDVMKGSGKLPQSSRSSTTTSYSNKNYTNISSKSNKKKPNLLENSNSPLFHGIPYLNYYKEKPSTEEDDSTSLISIWAPTVKDELITPKENTNPPLSFKTPNLETAEHVNKSLISANDPSETTSTDSDSELSNNYGSDGSPNDHNEETFGKYDDLTGKLKPSKSELSLSELSEATLKCELWKKNIAPKLEKHKSRDSEQLKNKTGLSRTENSVTETKPMIKQVNNQNNSRPQFQSKNKNKVICNGKYGKRRGVPNRSLTSKFTHLSIDPKEVLSVSRENLTIQGARLSSDQKSKNLMNVEKRFAIETREVVGKRGKEIQKVTYVQGKIIEKTSKIRNDYHQQKLKWDNDICVIKPQIKESISCSNHVTNYELPQNILGNYKCFPNRQHNFKDVNDFEDSDFKHIKNDDREVFPNRNRRSNCNYHRRREYLGYPNKAVKNLKAENGKEHSKILEHFSSFKIHYENRSHLSEKTDFQHSAIKPVNDYKFQEKVRNSTLESKNFHKQQRIPNELSWNVIDSSKKEHITREKFMQENPKIKQQTLPKFSDNGMSTDTNKIKTKGFSNIGEQDNFLFLESCESKNGSEKNTQLIKANITLLKNTDIELEERLALESLALLRASKLREEIEKKKSMLKFNVKEMADLIVGSYRALDIFKSFYHEWIELRQESIILLEQILNAIINSSNKSDKIKDIATMFTTAANVISLVPHPAVSLGAKIAATVGGIVSKIFGQGYSKKDCDAKEFEVKQVFQRDIDTSSLVYIYGVQCCSQFQETTQFIEKFHGNLQEENFQSFITDKDSFEFLKEISEYNPLNESIFYRRLKLEYERLIKNSKSDESRAFVRVFRDMPEAVSVINLLPWKFSTDGFDNSIVQNAWEELFSLFNSGTVNIDEFMRKIQNCLFFLKKEKALLERTVQNVF